MATHAVVDKRALIEQAQILGLETQETAEGLLLWSPGEDVERLQPLPWTDVALWLDEFGQEVAAQDQRFAEDAMLSGKLQNLAVLYIDARRRSGEALLETATYISQARDAAKHGEWQIWLEATKTSEDAAKRLLDIHRLAAENPQFAEAIKLDMIGQTVAGLLARPSTPPEVRGQVLAASESPSKREVERLIAEIRPNPAPVQDLRTGVIDKGNASAPTLVEVRQRNVETLTALSRHGWGLVGAPRLRGGSVLLDFVHGGTGEEAIDVAEGELPYWLEQLDGLAKRRAAPVFPPDLVDGGWELKQGTGHYYEIGVKAGQWYCVLDDTATQGYRTPEQAIEAARGIERDLGAMLTREPVRNEVMHADAARIEIAAAIEADLGQTSRRLIDLLWLACMREFTVNLPPQPKTYFEKQRQIAEWAAESIWGTEVARREVLKMEVGRLLIEETI